MKKEKLVIAVYRPHKGKEAALTEMVKKHFPLLLEYGLTTERVPFIGKSEDGAVVEIFEWKNHEFAMAAHDHPAVSQIWEAMAQFCDFGKLSQLKESDRVFPKFEPFN